MNTAEDVVAFALSDLVYEDLTVVGGWYFRNFSTLQFLQSLLNLLRRWVRWFMKFFRDIEDHVTPDLRSSVLEMAFPVYLGLREILNEVEFDLRAFRHRREGLRALPSRNAHYVEELKRNRKLEIEALLFLQQLPDLYSSLKQPIPIRRTAWIPTVPSDLSTLQQTIKVFKVEMRGVVRALGKALVSRVPKHYGLKKLEESQAISLTLNRDVSSGSETDDKRKYKIIAECEAEMKEIMRSNPEWQALQRQMVQNMTVMDNEYENQAEEGRLVECSHSFVRRFLFLVWTVTAKGGGAIDFADCLLRSNMLS